MYKKSSKLTEYSLHDPPAPCLTHTIAHPRRTPRITRVFPVRYSERSWFLFPSKKGDKKPIQIRLHGTINQSLRQHPASKNGKINYPPLKEWVTEQLRENWESQWNDGGGGVSWGFGCWKIKVLSQRYRYGRHSSDSVAHSKTESKSPPREAGRRIWRQSAGGLVIRLCKEQPPSWDCEFPGIYKW